MRSTSALAVLLLFAAALAGCAVPGSPVRDETEQLEIERLRQEQQEMTRELERLQDNLLLMEARLRDQENMLEEGPAQKVTRPGEKAGPPSSPGAPPPPEIRIETDTAAADLYRQAFGDFASAQHQQAIAGFETFLRLYPRHEQAPNALFWLGECYYAQQQYPKAAEAFAQAADFLPPGGRAPDALLRLATALKQMLADQQAGEVLQLLREKYPESAAARKSQAGD